ASPQSQRQGGCQHARALRRHEAPRAGGAGAGASPAGDRARRADCGCGRGVATGAVDVHPPVESRRSHHRAHHPLSGRGRDALQSRCAAEVGQDRCARYPGQHHPPLPGHLFARARRGCAAARAGRQGQRGRSGPSVVQARRLRAGGDDAGRVARGRLPPARSRSDAARSRGSLREPGTRRGAGMKQESEIRGGFSTLLYKELLRFWKVGFQTIAAPILTAMLYLLIFGHVLEDHVEVYENVGYTSFLVPGLVMMSMLQNAFANSSSSLIQSKVTGNVVFVLLPPLSYLEFYGGYLIAAMIRGLAVGLGVLLVALPFVSLRMEAPVWVILFAIAGTGILGTLGVIAGIWADKFDQLAAFQNFIILPLTFLSGVFYSIYSLPPFWQDLSHLNPFFYMIDGFRYGFFGVSDVDPRLSFVVVVLFNALLTATTLALLKRGYKLRH